MYCRDESSLHNSSIANKAIPVRSLDHWESKCRYLCWDRASSRADIDWLSALGNCFQHVHVCSCQIDSRIFFMLWNHLIMSTGRLNRRWHASLIDSGRRRSDSDLCWRGWRVGIRMHYYACRELIEVVRADLVVGCEHLMNHKVFSMLMRTWAAQCSTTHKTSLLSIMTMRNIVTFLRLQGNNMLCASRCQYWQWPRSDITLDAGITSSKGRDDGIAWLMT